MDYNPHTASAQVKGLLRWLIKQEKKEDPIRISELDDAQGAVYDPAFGWRKTRHQNEKNA